MTAMVTVTVVTGDGNVNIDDDDDDHRNVPTLSVKLMAFSLSSSRTKLVGGLGTSRIRGARGCPSATLIQCRCRTCRHYVYFKSKHTEGQNRMSFFSFLLFSSSSPRSGELRTQKLKSHLVRTQSLNVLPFKPGVGQYIAIHATLTARDFFLAYFYTSRSIHLHFVQNLSRFFPVLAVANTGSCVGPQNKRGHPAGCRFPC